MSPPEGTSRKWQAGTHMPQQSSLIIRTATNSQGFWEHWHESPLNCFRLSLGAPRPGHREGNHIRKDLGQEEN